MSRQSRKSLCESRLSGAVEAGPMNGALVPVCRETWGVRVHPVEAPREEVGPQACRVGPPRQNGQLGLVGPPIRLTVVGWFLFGRLRSLGILLMAFGQATEPLAGQTRNQRAGRGGPIWQSEAAASVAARSVSALVDCRSCASAAQWGQTQRTRDVGQLCQLAKWLKRYKTGMFANLANLANVFSQHRPAAAPLSMLV